MLWSGSIPRVERIDDAGRRSAITVVAGRLGDAVAPPPPPRSWASRAEADVAIWTLALDPEATIWLPRANDDTVRTLYVFRGDAVTIAGKRVARGHAALLRGDADVTVSGGREPTELLMLQGRPIGEPVASHGPFVMNAPAEIEQAYRDYRATRFGGWPWRSDGPVHARDAGRFALRPDGVREVP
jgi:redox-sensitive bicupin YhaK (pirin superfamily)